MVPENLGWGLLAEVFSRSIIICLDEARTVLIRAGRQVGLARQGSAQAADGGLDAALLPGRVGRTEAGIEAESMEGVMPRKFRTVIEGDRLAPGGGQRRQQGLHGLGDGGRRSYRVAARQSAGGSGAHGESRWRGCRSGTASGRPPSDRGYGDPRRCPAARPASGAG